MRDGGVQCKSKRSRAMVEKRLYKVLSATIAAELWRVDLLSRNIALLLPPFADTTAIFVAQLHAVQHGANG